MKLVVETNKPGSYINPDIYGHFSEHLGRGIYEGLYVGENSDIPNTDGIRNDVLSALKEIEVPVLRWPGGCFADEYHWKDGIGPKDQRKKLVNNSWGGVTEDNSFGTHEFMRLCELLGCKAYVNGNLGTGTAQETAEWVEYMTGTGESPITDLRKKNGRKEPWKVDYFAIGNESWGCGGHMRPGYYADLYRHYATFVRNYDPKNPIKKICVGPGTEDTKWTEVVLDACYEDTLRSEHGFMDYITIHHYVVPGTWEEKGSATTYSDELWYKSLKKATYMERIINKNKVVLNKFDPEEKIALCVDEWGGWYDVEPGTNPGFLYQQNTIRDALIAGVTMDIFNRHSDRVKMACIAQMVNVLQSVVLTDGPDMVKTPTFYVFKQYKHHQGANYLPTTLVNNPTEGSDEWQIPVISASSSVKDNIVTLTMSNASMDKEEVVEIDLSSDKDYKVLEASIVTSENIRDFNDFRSEEKVAEKKFESIKAENGKFIATIPAHSVIMIRFA